MADILALLNMPNAPKAKISACPSRTYPHMACILAGSLGLIRYFYGNLGAKGLMPVYPGMDPGGTASGCVLLVDATSYEHATTEGRRHH